MGTTGQGTSGLGTLCLGTHTLGTSGTKYQYLVSRKAFREAGPELGHHPPTCSPVNYSLLGARLSKLSSHSKM